ncbi:hypothetical protein FN846DRAFT_956720 [Sphaerosporella brunnea]|uniref:Uncharacterized protein n=1 Tax=Sphaerosporella brunnea TaxID=1250544 RepID=A0A5J5ESE5_9PEZI|nr:hypothetical protein FN846DRAFT_956720 [Sphaerosporella brunnea]
MLARHAANRLLILRPHVPAFRRWNSDVSGISAVSGDGSHQTPEVTPEISQVAGTTNATLETPKASETSTPTLEAPSSSVSETSDGTTDAEASPTSTRLKIIRVAEIPHTPKSFSASENNRSNTGFRVTAEEWHTLTTEVKGYKQRIYDLELVVRSQHHENQQLFVKMNALEASMRSERYRTNDFIVNVSIPIHLMIFAKFAYRTVTNSVRPAFRRLEGFRRLREEEGEEVASEAAQEAGTAEGAVQGAAEGAVQGAAEGAAQGAAEGAAQGAVEESQSAQDSNNASTENTLQLDDGEITLASEGVSKEHAVWQAGKVSSEDPFKDPEAVAERFRQLKDKYGKLGLKNERDMSRLADSYAALNNVSNMYPFTVSGDSTYRIYNYLQDEVWRHLIRCLFPIAFGQEIENWPRATKAQRDIILLNCGSRHRNTLNKGDKKWQLEALDSEGKRSPAPSEQTGSLRVKRGLTSTSDVNIRRIILD